MRNKSDIESTIRPELRKIETRHVADERGDRQTAQREGVPDVTHGKQIVAEKNDVVQHRQTHGNQDAAERNIPQFPDELAIGQPS